IVLKLTLCQLENRDPTTVILDDKELLGEFEKEENLDEHFVKIFSFNLLKTKYLLDNYIVHHSNEDDIVDKNPWGLQILDKNANKISLKNLYKDNNIQNKILQLLSMFEVSFTARQRKNYLFYILLYLSKNYQHNNKLDNDYYKFLSGLADKYFKDVYLDEHKLNEVNVPKPNSFDETILKDNDVDLILHNEKLCFNKIFGDSSNLTKRIPLFLFNYLDFKLWEKYTVEFPTKKELNSKEEKDKFFCTFGCEDFGSNIFDQFYFSRTRRSLEHYFPHANATGSDGFPDINQINYFGNFAMIGNDANSSGSNWSPKTKLDHYMDASGKINQVGVASIKFRIMMQICKDNQGKRDPGKEWIFEDIKNHQSKMLSLLNVDDDVESPPQKPEY
ncbi:MAG: DUF262 domain-containing protein, partial [Deltaproteobacteria bacterium]|nr:DUF262 domain-containing protein [Deltaproteobacteria bacterium]